MNEYLQLRLEALRLAIPVDRPHQHVGATLTTADRYLAWLIATPTKENNQ